VGESPESGVRSDISFLFVCMRNLFLIFVAAFHFDILRQAER
jgi:hypothetical protein